MILDTGWSGAEIPLLRGYWMLVTGCWMQDTDYRLPITDYWILVGAERKSRFCGNTYYRLPDEGMIKFLYPVSSIEYPVSILIIHSPTNRDYTIK